MGNKRWERWEDIPDLVKLEIKALERQRLTLGEPAGGYQMAQKLILSCICDGSVVC